MIEPKFECPKPCYERRNMRAEPRGDCIGKVATQYATSDFSPEGIMVEICPRESLRGEEPFFIEYCGNGADVMVIHADREQTPAELAAAVKRYDESL